MDGLVQGSTEWLQWRAKGIGGSDCPIIMGVSPWKTPYQLWKDKCNPVQGPSLPNFQQQRGLDLEPKARARYEFSTGITAPPALIEHQEFPYFRVSLDGWNPEKGVVLEIKCPGKDDHAKAKAGSVPEKYVYQLEMQLWVSGGTEAHYFSYTEIKGRVDTALVIYHSDPEKREKMINALHEFWNCVQTNTPPALTERDAMELNDIKSKSIFGELQKALQEKEELATKLDSVVARVDELKAQAIEIMPHATVVCSGVELKKIVTKGRVDYSKLNINENDLEKHRGPDSISYRLSHAD